MHAFLGWADLDGRCPSRSRVRTGTAHLGLTCNNVPNAKRRCVVGEDQSEDRAEIEAERQLRQCDTGPNSSDTGPNSSITSDPDHRLTTIVDEVVTRL